MQPLAAPRPPTPAPSSRRRRRLRHPAFEPSPGGRSLPLAEAELTDRWRIAVVLQGAALLAHLEHAGRRLADGWEGARVDGEGGLRLGAVAPGRDRRMPQQAVCDLAARLFGGDQPVAGRGEARRAARALLGRWRQTLAPISADELVGRLLDTAAFLWDADLAVARAALAAEHRCGGASHLWVAGPGSFRTRLLAAAADLGALVELLAGPSAARMWSGDEPGDPHRLAAAGRWRAAVAFSRSSTRKLGGP